MPEKYIEGAYFSSHKSEQIWQRYCGFLDLDMTAYMEIQEYLLMQQIETMAGTPLGKALMGSRPPASVEEFRRTVPISGYARYAPYIGERQREFLGEEPYFWCHTAGRGGTFKWIPYTKAAFDKIAKYSVAVSILSSADERGDIRLTPGDKLLVNLSQRPYASGTWFQYFGDYFPFKFIPSGSQAEEPDFKKRTEIAFRMALEHGIDYIFCMSSVLVKIGGSFSEKERKMGFSRDMLTPGIAWRYGKSWIKSRLTGRPILPRDLWKPKGLVTFGADTNAYQDEITRLWGRVPYQFYGTTESMVGAIQAWNKKGLTFIPDFAFWEFIPEEEWRKEREDPDYQPATVLMDGLEAGKQYELVLTHFYGMPLMRYRIGDVMRVLALEDSETGVKLPQVVFQARASEIIDMAGLTQIDERTMLQAILDSHVHFEDWCAKKEFHGGASYVRVYIETKESVDPGALEGMLESSLREIHAEYRDLEGWLGQRRTVRVTLLPQGAYRRFYEIRTQQDAPLARLRPSHINPAAEDIEQLLQLTGEGLGVP